MSNQLVDLGYIQFQLNSKWIVRSRLDIEATNISLVRGNATCELRLLGSGSIDREGNLENLYEKVSNQARSRGMHFDDLSEEFNHEFLSELQSEGDSHFQHVFIRLVGNVLVLAAMMGYDQIDEDEIRGMLATMEPGSERVSVEPFSPLPTPKVISNWSSLGAWVFFNGVD